MFIVILFLFYRELTLPTQFPILIEYAVDAALFHRLRVVNMLRLKLAVLHE